MFPYFIFLFSVVIIVAFSKKLRLTPQASKFFGFIAFALLVLFAGLRDSNVGTDTNNYIGSFNSDRNDEYSIFEIKSSLEVGYLILEKVAKVITIEYWFLLTLIAFITVFFYYKTILKLSSNYTISFFVFITLATYLFFFNGARQGIAAAIYSFSIIHIIKGNFKKYLLWIGIAFLFHKTVLITLPMYYFFRLKFSIKNLILITAISVIIIVFSFELLSFLPESFSYRYTQYQDRGASGGILLTYFYLFITFFFIFSHKFISSKHQKQYDIFLNMIIFNTLVYTLVSFFGYDINLMRLSQYFALGFVLIWPIIFKEASSKLLPLLFLFFTFGHLAFYYIYLGKMSRLTPYILNQTIFTN